MFTNKITGESYVGQSINLHKRYICHKTIIENKRLKDENTYFHRCAMSYSFEDYEYQILEACNKEDLDSLEVYYIDKYNTRFPNGYNITKGGSIAVTTSKITDQQYEEIIELLKCSDLTNSEIGELYDLTDQSISNINCGITHKNPEYKYPIRKSNEFMIQFCIRNGKQQSKVKCVMCGKTIYRNKSTMCNECRKKEYIKSLPSVDELINTICETQCWEVAGKRYGISGNGFRKWCKIRNLPIHIGEYADYFARLKE